ncbi:MAG: hypothetical protein IT186_27625 [Acidobacteria bacterium]|nr:hypothetical protein [Acidobacteriota bacterium]MCG3193425.1 Heme-binding protein A [Thermoanaerobaculia bacterium]
MLRAGLPILLVALAAYAWCRRVPAPSFSTLNVATRADVTGIFPNPPYQAEVFSIDMNANVFDSLVRFDRDLGVVPALAEGWENPDELSWNFHLRPGVKFSDGTDVLASDVVASLRMMAPRNTPLLPEDSIEAVGPGRVVIRTHLGTPHLLAHLQSAFILPEKALLQSPVPSTGSGPYRFAGWTPGRDLVLERNSFYRPAPAFERVLVQVMPSGSERIEALVSGRAQVADSIPPEEVSRLEREPGIRVVSQPSLRVLFLAFRVDRAPFSDIRVRRAARLALDQRDLIQKALRGMASPATQLVAPQIPGYNSEIPESIPDLAEARRLLAEAGYPAGLDLRLDGPSDRYINDVEILEEIGAQLARAGMRVTVNAMPKGRYLSSIRSGASSFFLMGWTSNTLFGGDVLEALVRTRGKSGQGDFNYMNISDATLDQLIEESLRKPDSRARLEAARKGMALVSEKELVVPLLVPRETVAFSRKIEWEPEIGLALRFEQMRPSAAAQR